MHCRGSEPVVCISNDGADRAPNAGIGETTSKEVQTTVSEILRIIEVSQNVAHAVSREWETKNGQTHRAKYEGRRCSPSHIQRIHESLLVLHQQMVVVRGRDHRKETRTDRVVHILDSFGYVYRQNGEVLDLDNLPEGEEKINISSDDRPVFQIKKRPGNPIGKPSGVLFRLNTELAEELSGKRGTIGFTIFAQKVFRLFQEHNRNPATIRLILLILRQTSTNFVRNLRPALLGLGFDVTHPKRAANQCTATLERLRTATVINHFDVDRTNNKLSVEVNRNWYQQ